MIMLWRQPAPKGVFNQWCYRCACAWIVGLVSGRSKGGKPKTAYAFCCWWLRIIHLFANAIRVVIPPCGCIKIPNKTYGILIRNSDPSSGNVGKEKKGNLIRRNERNGPRQKCCLSLELCAELCFNVFPVFTWIYAFSSMYVWREGTETEKKSTNGIPPQPHTATYAPNYFFLPSE